MNTYVVCFIKLRRPTAPPAAPSANTEVDGDSFSFLRHDTGVPHPHATPTAAMAALLNHWIRRAPKEASITPFGTNCFITYRMRSPGSDDDGVDPVDVLLAATHTMRTCFISDESDMPSFDDGVSTHNSEMPCLPAVGIAVGFGTIWKPPIAFLSEQLISDACDAAMAAAERAPAYSVRIIGAAADLLRAQLPDIAADKLEVVEGHTLVTVAWDDMQSAGVASPTVRTPMTTSASSCAFPSFEDALSERRSTSSNGGSCLEVVSLMSVFRFIDAPSSDAQSITPADGQIPLRDTNRRLALLTKICNVFQDLARHRAVVGGLNGQNIRVVTCGWQSVVLAAEFKPSCDKDTLRDETTYRSPAISALEMAAALRYWYQQHLQRFGALSIVLSRGATERAVLRRRLFCGSILDDDFSVVSRRGGSAIENGEPQVACCHRSWREITDDAEGLLGALHADVLTGADASSTFVLEEPSVTLASSYRLCSKECLDGLYRRGCTITETARDDARVAFFKLWAATSLMRSDGAASRFAAPYLSSTAALTDCDDTMETELYMGEGISGAMALRSMLRGDEDLQPILRDPATRSVTSLELSCRRPGSGHDQGEVLLRMGTPPSQVANLLTNTFAGYEAFQVADSLVRRALAPAPEHQRHIEDTFVALLRALTRDDMTSIENEELVVAAYRAFLRVAQRFRALDGFSHLDLAAHALVDIKSIINGDWAAGGQRPAIPIHAAHMLQTRPLLSEMQLAERYILVAILLIADVYHTDEALDAAKSTVPPALFKPISLPSWCEKWISHAFHFDMWRTISSCARSFEPIIAVSRRNRETGSVDLLRHVRPLEVLSNLEDSDVAAAAQTLLDAFSFLSDSASRLRLRPSQLTALKLRLWFAANRKKAVASLPVDWNDEVFAALDSDPEDRVVHVTLKAARVDVAEATSFQRWMAPVSASMAAASRGVSARPARSVAFSQDMISSVLGMLSCFKHIEDTLSTCADVQTPAACTAIAYRLAKVSVGLWIAASTFGDIEQCASDRTVTNPLQDAVRVTADVLSALSQPAVATSTIGALMLRLQSAASKISGGPVRALQDCAAFIIAVKKRPQENLRLSLDREKESTVSFSLNHAVASARAAMVESEPRKVAVDPYHAGSILTAVAATAGSDGTRHGNHDHHSRTLTTLSDCVAPFNVDPDQTARPGDPKWELHDGAVWNQRRLLALESFQRMLVYDNQRARVNPPDADTETGTGITDKSLLRRGAMWALRFSEAVVADEIARVLASLDLHTPESGARRSTIQDGHFVQLIRSCRFHVAFAAMCLSVIEGAADGVLGGFQERAKLETKTLPPTSSTGWKPRLRTKLQESASTSSGFPATHDASASGHVALSTAPLDPKGASDNTPQSATNVASAESVPIVEGKSTSAAPWRPRSARGM